MNLIEAIKTGKPFRRSGWVNRVFILYQHGHFLEAESPHQTSRWAEEMCRTSYNFLADDWEIEDAINNIIDNIDKYVT